MNDVDGKVVVVSSVPADERWLNRNVVRACPPSVRDALPGNVRRWHFGDSCGEWTSDGYRRFSGNWLAHTEQDG